MSYSFLMWVSGVVSMLFAMCAADTNDDADYSLKN